MEIKRYDILFLVRKCNLGSMNIENQICICYTMPRQKDTRVPYGTTKPPQGRNLWGLLFRFGKVA